MTERQNQPIPKKLEKIVQWTKEASKSVSGLLVPVSGGTDSALSFWVCSQARPGEVLGVHTQGPLRAKEWFESLGEVVTVDTPGNIFEAEEMRWAKFLYMSREREYGLVGNRTRTEDLLGNYSLASRVATIYPIIGIWKSDVINLCQEVGVPDEVIKSSSEPDCECGRPPKLAEIPFPVIDSFLKKETLGEKNVDLSDLSPEQEKYLKGVVVYTAFKKELPYRGPTA